MEVHLRSTSDRCQELRRTDSFGIPVRKFFGECGDQMGVAQGLGGLWKDPVYLLPEARGQISGV